MHSWHLNSIWPHLALRYLRNIATNFKTDMLLFTSTVLFVVYNFSCECVRGWLYVLSAKNGRSSHHKQCTDMCIVLYTYTYATCTLCQLLSDSSARKTIRIIDFLMLYSCISNCKVKSNIIYVSAINSPSSTFHAELTWYSTTGMLRKSYPTVY